MPDELTLTGTQIQAEWGDTGQATEPRPLKAPHASKHPIDNQKDHWIPAENFFAQNDFHSEVPVNSNIPDVVIDLAYYLAYIADTMVYFSKSKGEGVCI